MKLRVLHLFREESAMSQSPTSSSKPSVKEQIQRKLAELAELVSEDHYGADGPSKETTFREIESVGHQVAQLAAAKFEATATKQHQQHFDTAQPCPQCQRPCQPGSLLERKLLTRLGPVALSDIQFDCNACRRSFFPSA